MITVTFEDRSKEFLQRLAEKANAACLAAAEELSDAYRENLSRVLAPPHSNPGQIPHAYDGPRPGGYDRTKKLSKFFRTRITKNNPSQVGFAKTQTDRLYTYIQARKSKNGAVVGFLRAGSHVTNRDFNYLIAYDLGYDTCPNPLAVSIDSNDRRPWVRPVFDDVRSSLTATAASFFSVGGSGDVPF